MKLSNDEMHTVESMHMLLTRLIYSKDTNPIERSFLDDVRSKVEAVRLMPVTPCD